MRLPGRDVLTGATWASYSEEPVWQSAWWEPRLSAPWVVMPDESPDKRWHLFAHSWVGVEHYISSSGFDWKRLGLVIPRAHFPSILKEKDSYHLVYEEHDHDYNGKRRLDMKRTVSRIRVVSSTDLVRWSDPVTILSAVDIAYASDYSVPRLSHPQLVPWQGGYRLYFGASEVRIPDTGQKASACLSYAEGTSLATQFIPRPRPIRRLDPDSRYDSLALGSFRMVLCSDGICAFQTAFFFDPVKESSASAMLLLSSEDGEDFKFERVIMRTPDEGWASRCFTSCCLSFQPDEDTWYCFFSANGHSRHPLMPIREKLGLLLGSVRRDYRREGDGDEY